MENKVYLFKIFLREAKYPSQCPQDFWLFISGGEYVTQQHVLDDKPGGKKIKT